MKQLFLWLCLIATLSSCTHQQKLNRAKRKLTKLVADYPELVKSDTVKVHDTTFVKGVSVDTVLQAGITHDTITIVKEKLSIKYFNDGKTVYIKGEVKNDTIVKEIPVIVNTVTTPVAYVPTFYRWSTYSFYILLFVIAATLWLIHKFK